MTRTRTSRKADRPRSGAADGARTRVLWAPWRMTFIGGRRTPGCIFCVLPADPDPRASLVLATTRHSVVMLNKYPYASGHLLVSPRRHRASLAELSRAEAADLDETLRAAAAIVARELRPEGMNLGMNVGAAAGAGIAEHLHWHVVPRWNGDVNFMTPLAEVRVIPQHLLETWDRLAPAFAALGGRADRGARAPTRVARRRRLPV